MPVKGLMLTHLPQHFFPPKTEQGLPLAKHASPTGSRNKVEAAKALISSASTIFSRIISISPMVVLVLTPVALGSVLPWVAPGENYT